MFCLTNRSEEDDGEEISDGLDDPCDLSRDHVTLRGEQSSGHETSQLHRNIQKLCYLQKHTQKSSSQVQKHNIRLEEKTEEVFI